jgi:HD-GYP domain-containing protein (c-di-GMP phosphodiesterase class II)
VLRAAWETLGVQILAWVPRNPEDTVVVEGDEKLNEWDARQLATWIAHSPEIHSAGLVIWNDAHETSWGERFPFIHNLMAMPMESQAPFGWLLAVNKHEAGTAMLGGVIAFRRSDAALLTPFAALLDLQVRSSGRYRELQDLLVGLAQSLTAAIDAKDSYTYGHSERVARIAVTLGRQLDLQEEELSDLFLAGLLHDIGKIGIRDAVLSKQGELTTEEFEHVKQHVLIGYSILQNLRPIAHLLPGVRNHHERFDGTGYPDGLAGETIPMMARILAVADAYDAMTTSRPYRHAISVAQVESILSEGAGTQWDPSVIDAFKVCRQRIHGIRQRGVGDSLRNVLRDVLRTQSSTLQRPLAATRDVPLQAGPP